jgi:hypothetical protein
VNVVCLVGRLIEAPQPIGGGGRYEVRIAVSRRLPGGLPEPGVVGLDVALPRLLPEQVEQLRPGALVALAGLVEVDEHWNEGVLRRRHEIVAESLEVLEATT